MTFNCYNIFSLTEFLAADLVSRTYTVFLQNVGQKDILVTKGNSVNVLFEDTLLPLQFAGKNPFRTAPYSVLVDDNNDVWLGIETE